MSMEDVAELIFERVVEPALENERQTWLSFAYTPGTKRPSH